jgi:protein-tyrosine phosphatase
MKVLFVCTGNLCRSPMAEVLLKDELRNRGCTGVEVVSSGTWGIDGSPATPEAVQAVGELDIDLSSHRARSLDVDEVRTADLVVAMTGVHVREIIQMVPGAEEKVVLLKQLRATKVEPLAADATPAQRLEALLAGQRPELVRVHDLDDPMGMPVGRYRQTVTELRDGIEHLADVICGPRPKAAPSD